MSRKVAIQCPHCRRRFGGDQTERRHRVIRGDRYVCLSPAELVGRGFTVDRFSVWHRGVDPNQGSLLTSSDTPQTEVPAPPASHLARITDPDTSKAAATLSGRAGTIRRKLLESYLEDGVGMTAEEASSRSGFTAEDGAWKRVSDLLSAGLLADTGGRRPGRSGRMQRVLVLTDEGRGILR